MFKALLVTALLAIAAITLRAPPSSAPAVGEGTAHPSNYDRGSPYYTGELIGDLPQNGEASKREPTVLMGRVVDDQGNPVAGVKVKLWSGFASRFAGQSTLTDSTGTYRFDPLETGAGMKGRYMPGVQIEHGTLVSADGLDWWDVEAPFGQTVTKDFTLTTAGHIAGSLTFGSGQWTLGEFPLKFTSSDKKRGAYATSGGGRGEFTSPALFPGEYDVTWNSAYPQSGQIIRVKVEAGKTTTFNANLIFEMKAECTETPTAK